MTWKVHVDYGALGSQEKQTFHIGGFVWQCSQRRSPLFDIRSCSYHQIRSLSPTWMPFAITIILIIRFIFNQDFKPFFQINTCYLFFVFVKLNLLSLSLSVTRLLSLNSSKVMRLLSKMIPEESYIGKQVCGSAINLCFLGRQANLCFFLAFFLFLVFYWHICLLFMNSTF